MGFLTWLQETEFAMFLASDPYAYPIILCMHAVGMAGVVGLVWVMSARVLGFAKSLSIETFHRMSTIALWGFALNTLSGLLIFSTEATRAIVNLEFQLKLTCILLGGLAVWMMMRTVRTAAAAGPDDSIDFPLNVKAVAVFSSAAWLLAIIFGRMIAYTIKPPF